MAKGVVFYRDGARSYEGKVTIFVSVSCFVASMGGFLFGYDHAVTAGVTSMEPFLKKFFPSVYQQMIDKLGHENLYCKYDNQLLTLFTSSFYLVALVASIFASTNTRMLGRKASIFLGSLFYFVGALLTGFAHDVHSLIIGRMLLGFAVGYCNQSIPIYLSEMAPPKIRGAFNMGFQMAITIGIFIANLINYKTVKYENGWRISLGMGAVPAVLMCFGSLFLGDTPNSMIERGQHDQAKKMLQKIRGVDNVDEEFQGLVTASEASKKVQNPWNRILEKKYRPQLILCTFIPCFQQLTGINVIIFYTPLLCKTLGFGNDASLMSAIIIGVVNFAATFVSILTVDKFGRRILFLEGGIQMFIFQVAIAVLIALRFGVSGQGSLSKDEAHQLLFLICGYIAAFAWSWGPLGWLLPSEICSLYIRSVGQAMNVAVNMLFSFFIAQAFLTMLCHLKFGLFLFFTCFLVIMTIFIALLLPETKGIPIEEINRIWKLHWFWSKFILEDAITSGSDHS